MLGLRMAKINTLVLILVFTVSLAANSSLLGTYHFAGDDYFQFDKSIADWFASTLLARHRTAASIAPLRNKAVGLQGLRPLSI